MGPNLDLEKWLWRQGYRRIIGLDEVGRGSLAGPVTVGGVVISSRFQRIPEELAQVRDSKKMTPHRREKVYPKLIANSCLVEATASSSAKLIDKLGIVKAVERAMLQVVRKLQPIDFIILDGRLSLPLLIDQYSLVGADDKVFSVAAASIIAKVRRDRLMKRYQLIYPQYNFQKHKGYGTAEHLKILEERGFSPIHRQSFRSFLAKTTISARVKHNL